MSTRSHRVLIDGLEFDPLTQAEVLSQITKVLEGKKTGVTVRIVKPYVEFFDGARRYAGVREAINGADYVIADSVAVQWAAAWLAEKRPTLTRFVWSLAVGLRRPDWLSRCIPERGEGASATHRVLMAAAQHGWRVGILGGPEDSQTTQRHVQEKYPMLQLQKVWSGYFSARDEASLARHIAKEKLDILFVALGFPKQELFMAEYAESGIARVMLGEGGTFDYVEMGGSLHRAPSWMRQSGLEWLWRLGLQPSRIGRQMSIPKFMWRIFKQSRLARRSRT